MTDTELRDLIETELLHDDRVCAQAIDVTIEDGVATLRGKTSSFRRKLATQHIVAAYEGVREVRNELTIEPLQDHSDNDIADAARGALNASADITKEAIVVSVAGGKVTLTGSVASHWERVVAEDVARGVRGVRDVVNMLVVDVAHKVDDAELMHSVQAALSRSRGLREANINVAIGDDTVVLSGEVSETWQKEVAQTVVGGFGLLHIRNDIRVSK